MSPMAVALPGLGMKMHISLHPAKVSGVTARETEGKKAIASTMDYLRYLLAQQFCLKQQL